MHEITPTKLAEVTRLLDKSRVPWGLFGGAAAKVFGAERPLRDIDILIPSDSGQRVSQEFPDAHLEYEPDGRIASLEIPYYDIVAGLHRRIHFTLDAEMVARINRHRLLGTDLPVLSIEDNIAFKAILGRGPEMGKHDWEDAALMLKNAPNLDWDYLRWRLHKCAPEKAASLEIRLTKFRNLHSAP
jgi:hypothetical protein